MSSCKLPSFTHPFHLVSPSPWPLLLSFSLLSCVLSFLSILAGSSAFSFLFSLSISGIILVSWFWNVVLEATFQGCHTIRVVCGLRLSLVLFILSECFFFLSFFWAYLHFSLSPNIELGSLWPPKGINPLDYSTIPLLNTCVLLTSALTVTVCHSSLLSSSVPTSLFYLLVTVLLGVFFTSLQAYEYHLSSFTISDSSYGSSFFLATGFHGFHVLVGTLWLSVSLPRLLSCHYSQSRHFCLEGRIWYWHFVDVIWLCLYLVIYIWGS